MIIYRRGRCPGGRRLKSLDLQWVGRGCFLWRTLPHNFANVSFAIITLLDNGHTLTSTFNWKTEINQICFRMTWSPNIVLDWILWIFRQSWLGSSWASIVPPPTSSPSCSSCSTRATGPSTSSSCPTSSSTGYQSESPDAQIVSFGQNNRLTNHHLRTMFGKENEFKSMHSPRTSCGDWAIVHT